MFVFNFKINKNNFMKIFKTVIIILAIIIFSLTIYSFFQSGKKNLNSKSENNIIELDSNNFTSFLKDCHENIDSYIDYEIRITGYIYRLPDFSNKQFVIARTMLYDSNNQAVVVGILCECDDAVKYNDYSWVSVEGSIKKGNYDGELPILKIKKISDTQMPENEFVYEPID